MRAKALLAVCATMLAACGGGGGGGNDKFAGVWSGGASLVDDTCGAISDTYAFISFNHLVNQDGDSVLLDNGLVTFSGSVTGDDSFSVAADRPYRALFEGATCTEHVTWRYDSIKRDTANFVVRNSTVTCHQGSTVQTCEFAFTGTAYRGNGHPIPVDIGIGGPVANDAGAGSTGSTEPADSVTGSDGSGVPESSL
ncbi:MAG: hypothetical protein U0136_05605 [Bdellovibrionota bacterium]